MNAQNSRIYVVHRVAVEILLENMCVKVVMTMSQIQIVSEIFSNNKDMRTCTHDFIHLQYTKAHFKHGSSEHLLCIILELGFVLYTSGFYCLI